MASSRPPVFASYSDIHCHSFSGSWVWNVVSGNMAFALSAPSR